MRIILHRKQSDGEAIYLGNPHGVIIEVPGQKGAVITWEIPTSSPTWRWSTRSTGPKIGLVPIGDRFTMGGKVAAMACDRFFEFDTIVPCHYGSFPIIDESADAFLAAMGSDAHKVASMTPGSSIDL